ncbi:MAG: chemotaxis protein CheX [Bryobacterales bacterium]|nr:chemotaxis protein CheX [Bryobacterales bacterium]
MEATEIHAALAAAVEEVLETMCFLGVNASGEGAGPVDPEAIPEPADEGDARMLTSELRFEGRIPGTFRLSLPLGLAQVAGAAFLALDEPAASEAQAGEVVCELSNMICGAALGRLEHGTIFRLSHPELVPVLPDTRLSRPGSVRWFDTGEGFLTVSLSLQPEYAS